MSLLSLLSSSVRFTCPIESTQVREKQKTFTCKLSTMSAQGKFSNSCIQYELLSMCFVSKVFVLFWFLLSLYKFLCALAFVFLQNNVHKTHKILKNLYLAKLRENLHKIFLPTLDRISGSKVKFYGSLFWKFFSIFVWIELSVLWVLFICSVLTNFMKVYGIIQIIFGIIKSLFLICFAITCWIAIHVL